MLLELRLFKLKSHVGKITYLYVFRLEECKACQSKGNSCFGPREDLYDIKVNTVVRFSYYSKLIRISLFFSISYQLIGLFYRFLDHYNRYDLWIYAMQVLFDVSLFVIADLRKQLFRETEGRLLQTSIGSKGKIVKPLWNLLINCNISRER